MTDATALLDVLCLEDLGDVLARLESAMLRGLVTVKEYLLLVSEVEIQRRDCERRKLEALR